jgi:hypothetical protein
MAGPRTTILEVVLSGQHGIGIDIDTLVLNGSG